MQKHQISEQLQKHIKEDYLGFSAEESITEILDAIPEAVLILNEQRHVVFINHMTMETFGFDNRESSCGLRPGEMFLCSHSDKGPNGCGTTEFCEYCGANIAILASQLKKTMINECRITQKSTGTGIDLKVKAAPFEIHGKLFTVLSILDVSDAKRKDVLQRLFFHDILNTAGGLSGYSELLKDSPGEDISEYTDIIHRLSVIIVDQINGQRQLLDAENGTLEVQLEEIVSTEIVENMVLTAKTLQEATDKHIVSKSNNETFVFNSDPTLISRILGNLIKNALEASKDGDSVTVGCRKSENRAEFSVQNPAVMSEEIKHQIFQRSFSTKGKGRGLGTYSVKLFTEKYLKGNIRFDSNESIGTIFYASFPFD